MKEILYDWGGANVWIFRFINSVNNLWWDRFMIVGTWLTDSRNVAILAGLGLVADALARGRSETTRSFRRASAVLALSYVLTSAIVFRITHTTDFARPSALLLQEGLRILEIPGDPFSFPSGHAALSGTLASALWPHLSIAWRVGPLIFVIWVAFSRVAVGAHFPADVDAGLLIGFLVPWVVRVIAGSIDRKPASRAVPGNTSR